MARPVTGYRTRLFIRRHVRARKQPRCRSGRLRTTYQQHHHRRARQQVGAYTCEHATRRFGRDAMFSFFLLLCLARRRRDETDSSWNEHRESVFFYNATMGKVRRYYGTTVRRFPGTVSFVFVYCRCMFCKHFYGAVQEGCRV